VGASDLVQDTFLEAHQDFSHFHGTGERELLAWLTKILTNRLCNNVRHYRGTLKRDIEREESLEMGGEGLPAPFLAALRRALRHYGVTDLDRSSALDEALYWIHQSQQRVSAQIPIVVDILERWLEQGPRDGTIDDGRRQTLDALVAATQRRHPLNSIISALLSEIGVLTRESN
jgi:DNA-directed RNA polymerase specialized sigma24 family protein